MKQNLQQLLSQVLIIIGYTDDKTAFVDEFINFCQTETITALMNPLPLEIRTELKRSLEQETAPGRIEEILLKQFSAEEIQKAFAKTLRLQFQSYMEAVYPTLSLEQKETLRAFLTSLEPHTSAGIASGGLPGR